MLNHDPSDIERRVAEAIAEVLNRPELTADSLMPDQRLVADLGLASLDLAQLVAILESELGVDPFREAVPITEVRTVGDVQEAYRAFLAGELGPASHQAALDDAARRADRRRDRG